MSNIKNTLHTLLAFYQGSRRAGHTTAAITGVVNTPRAVLVFENYRQRNIYRCSGMGTPSTAALSDLDHLRGRSCPIVLDNSAVIALAQDSLREIERLEAENAKLKAENAKLKADKSELLLDLSRARNRRLRLEIKLDGVEEEIAWLKLPLWEKALHRAAKYLRSLGKK